jgi:hypothetical protein
MLGFSLSFLEILLILLILSKERVERCNFIALGLSYSY